MEGGVLSSSSSSASVPPRMDLSMYGGATANELLLIAPYMYKYDPKKDDHVIPPNEDRNTKFLRQVRHSMGYEVTAYPQDSMGSPFIGLRLNRGYPEDDEDVKNTTDFAIETINRHSGKKYKFVKTDHAVYARNRMFLLSFTVQDEEKEPDDPDSLTRFRAMVFDPYGRKPEMRLMEYKKLFPNGNWELMAELNTGKSILKECIEQDGY